MRSLLYRALLGIRTVAKFLLRLTATLGFFGAVGGLMAGDPEDLPWVPIYLAVAAATMLVDSAYDRLMIRLCPDSNLFIHMG